MPASRWAKKYIDREGCAGRGMKVRAGQKGRDILEGWVVYE